MTSSSPSSPFIRCCIGQGPQHQDQGDTTHLCRPSSSSSTPRTRSSASHFRRSQLAGEGRCFSTISHDNDTMGKSSAAAEAAASSSSSSSSSSSTSPPSSSSPSSHSWPSYTSIESHRQSHFHLNGRPIFIHSQNEQDHSTSSPHFPSFAAHTSSPPSSYSSSSGSSSTSNTDAVQSALASAIDIQRGSSDVEGKEAVDTSLLARSELARKVRQDAEADKDRNRQQLQVEEEEQQEEEESAVSGAYLISYFVAGGAAGAASRTVVSPLERLKIIMQVQPSSAGKGKAAYNGVISGLIKMWQEEGFAGYMRGNGINCLRIVPYSAVQFCTYEIAKDKLKSPDGGEMTTVKRLAAGALAGTASCVATFPLDLVRARISIASASLYADAKAAVASVEASTPAAKSAVAPTVAAPQPSNLSRSEMRAVIAERQKRVPGIWGMTLKVYREEGGIRGLYRGCIPTAAGVAPYVAINFAAYEALRKHVVEASLSADGHEGEIGTGGKLLCGALAGSISQSLTFPLDVLRRRMQVAGMKNSKLGYSDKNAIDAIRNILRSDGVLGLYRGLWPNLLKVAPSIGTSFLVYESVQAWVHPHPPHHHPHGEGGKSEAKVEK